MRQTRRTFLQGAAAASLAGALPTRSIAQMTLGSATLTTVSDGHLVLPRSFIFGPMPQDDLPAVLDGFDLPEGELRPECNLTLYRDGTNTVLFDAGSGADFMPSAGMIADSLDAVGVAPEDITHVVFTHAHPDHIWGTLDDFGDLMFMNATHMIGRAEWDYWSDPATLENIGEERMAFAVGAKNRLTAIEDAVEFFDDDQEVLPGILSVASYGHTPGHMSFEVRNGSEAAFVIGDAIGNHHVAFRRPDWPSGSDQDMDMAIATRQRLFDRITADDLAIAGFHLPNGGMGRVETGESGYRFIQEET